MKRRLIIMTGLILGLTLGTSVETLGQGFGDRNSPGGEGSFGIMVKVIGPNGKPVADVRVAANTQDFKNYAGTTDKEGAIRFGGLSPGNYTVTVPGGGDFETENETILIGREQPGGQNFNVILYLRPKASKASVAPGVISLMLVGAPKEAVEKYKSAAEAAAKNNRKDALSLLDQAIVIYPQFALAFNEKGLLHQAEGDFDTALNAFKRAVLIKSDYFEPKLNYGITLYKKKDLTAAEGILTKVLDERKDVPLGYMYLGMTWVVLGKIDQAEAALKYAIGLKGGDELDLAHRFLGGIYMQKKQYKEAIRELGKYLDLVPSAPDAEKIKATIADLKKKV